MAGTVECIADKVRIVTVIMSGDKIGILFRPVSCLNGMGPWEYADIKHLKLTDTVILPETPEMAEGLASMFIECAGFMRRRNQETKTDEK